jgi:hypothetical protein
MTGTTLSALKAAQNSLLLKPLDAVVFLAPWYTAAPTSYTDSTATLQTLPTAFKSVGYIDKKSGVAFARNITAAPIDSYGELEPTRDDVTDDVTTLEFEPQETNVTTLQLTTNTNLAAVLADGSSGEVFFAQPIAPQITYYSAIVIGKDGNDAAPIYIIKHMPKVAVTKYAGEQWTPTTLVSQKLTLTAFKDDTVGYAVGHGFGGLGWKNILSQTGFTYTVSAITVTPTTLSLSHTGSPSAPLVVKDQMGTVIPNASVTFTSSQTSYATVASTGIVTPVAAGSTTVTASYTPPGAGSPLTATCSVTVT